MDTKKVLTLIEFEPEIIDFTPEPIEFEPVVIDFEPDSLARARVVITKVSKPRARSCAKNT
jgi:hypothetical protein